MKNLKNYLEKIPNCLFVLISFFCHQNVLSAQSVSSSNRRECSVDSSICGVEYDVILSVNSHHFQLANDREITSDDHSPSFWERLLNKVIDYIAALIVMILLSLFVGVGVKKKWFAKSTLDKITKLYKSLTKWTL